MVSRTKKRLFWTTGIIVGAVVLLLVLGPSILYKERSNWICTVSGSTRTDITWFGFFKHEERTSSALEDWLRRKEPGFQPSWRQISTQKYYLMGSSCATAGTPEVYSLTPVLQSEGFRKLSDERIASLVEVLRHGSAEQQRQMISNITDEALSKD
jgi:hypothetical protein